MPRNGFAPSAAMSRLGAYAFGQASAGRDVRTRWAGGKAPAYPAESAPGWLGSGAAGVGFPHGVTVCRASTRGMAARSRAAGLGDPSAGVGHRRAGWWFERVACAPLRAGSIGEWHSAFEIGR